MLAHLRKSQLTAIIFCSLCFLTYVTGAPEVAPSNNVTSTTNTTANFDCPIDCTCTLITNAHKPMLHAKCSSIDDLRSETPLTATLPIHSIDLSYLGLSRLSHSLEKLHDLTSIDLSHNELHEVGHLGRRIKKLNLKHNRLTSSKLTKLPQHVQVLNLQHNDITYLPLEMTKLIHLQSLELSHNQINCSCETLEVRNWLQDKPVFMEHPVKCTYPAETRGKSWLQIKQSDICDKEKSGYYNDTDENELMLGDQAIEGSAEHAEEEEELGKAFMPLNTTPAKSNEAMQFHDVEGSGDLSEMSLPLAELTATTAEPPILAARTQEEPTTEIPHEDEEEDGSGSGGGILILPALHESPIVRDDFDAPESVEEKDDLDNKPVPAPAAEPTPSPEIFGNGMGIFDGQEQPAIEETIEPIQFHNVDAAAAPAPAAGGAEVTTEGAAAELLDGASTDGPAVMHAEVGPKDESNATYLLLGVIALIVVGLILFVGIKRCKHQRNARHDAENPRPTELLDMDKKNLGKPLPNNGVEHIPLIPEKSKADLAKPINGAGKKPYDASDVKDGPNQQQPLLNGNGTTNGQAPVNNEQVPRIEEPATEAVPPHQYYPIAPIYPPPKSPRASKYAQNPQNEANNNNDDAFLPSSPKSGRYSPVYSPETGRVKIKLTETPRPKTPMLVTRSKSNAGDIITTPVHIANLDAVQVGGGGGGAVAANGHIEH